MSSQTVDMVQVQVSRWDVEFSHRLSALIHQTRRRVVTAAVRRHDDVPRGSVLMYVDPHLVGRLVILYHRDDYEATYAAIGREPLIGRVASLERVNPLESVHV